MKHEKLIIISTLSSLALHLSPSLAFMTTTVTSVGLVYQVSPWRWGKSPISQPKTTTPLIMKLAALTRLEPESEVIRLGAPLPLDSDRKNCDQ